MLNITSPTLVTSSFSQRLRIWQTSLSLLAKPVALSLLLAIPSNLEAAPRDCFSRLDAVPDSILTQTRGGQPDSNGLVGSNKPSFKGSHYQRGAMDRMIVGIFTDNTTLIDEGWAAIEATFQRQTAAGNFAKDQGGEDNGQDVAFWTCWLTEALHWLQLSPHAADYSQQLADVKPKIERCLDYLLQPEVINFRRFSDKGSPNRAIIQASTFLLASTLVEEALPSKQALWQSEARWWLERVFHEDKLFSSSDGVFREGGGLDTSYQAVAISKLLPIYAHFPTIVPNFKGKLEKASDWMNARVCLDGTLDNTLSSRCGPGNIEGSSKTIDEKEIKRALMKAAAFLERADYGQTIDRMVSAKTATPLNGLSPVFYSSDQAQAVVDVPFSFTVMATNGDTTQGSTAVTVSGLPSGVEWIIADDSNFTFCGKLSGTFTEPGQHRISFVASSSFGTASQDLVIDVVPEGLPHIELAEIPRGMVFQTGKDILFQASAWTPAATGAKSVEFFANGALVHSASTAPFDYSWKEVPEGVHYISATVNDLEGGSAEAAQWIEARSVFYEEKGGYVTIQGESPSYWQEDQWKELSESSPSGSVGFGEITDGTYGRNDWDAGAEACYLVKIEWAGDYKLEFTHRAGDKRADSVWLGVDGKFVQKIDVSGTYGAWNTKVSTRIYLDEGLHRIQLRRREDGYQLDKIEVISQNPPKSQ